MDENFIFRKWCFFHYFNADNTRVQGLYFSVQYCTLMRPQRLSKQTGVKFCKADFNCNFRFGSSELDLFYCTVASVTYATYPKVRISSGGSEGIHDGKQK